MAFCSICGSKIEDNAKFCSSCGNAVNVLRKNNGEQRKTIYDGDLHKCPQCGERLNAFATICPVCNYELRGVRATSCVHELSQKLENTESEDQKKELISNFYIPNTKEDIYEFFILAYSNITAGGYGMDAWSIKLEQAYLKAKLAFGNNEEFEYIKELYESINKASKKNRITNSKSYKGTVLMIAGALAAIISMLIYYILTEFDIWWYDLKLVTGIGFICFIIGLVLFILPNKSVKKKNK